MNDHIQISDVTPRIQYAADGSQTQFSFPFPIFVEDDLEVYTGDDKRISGYSVLGAGTSYGGSVTFDAPPPSGVVVTLRRSLAIERTTDFQQSGAFRAKVVNDELDYLTAALQQVADDVGRAVRLSSTDADAVLELPSKDERANKVLGFDASGAVTATTLDSSSDDSVTDHGQLSGLSDDDHPLYHNNARGDARYYTQAQIDASFGSKSDITHKHDATYAPMSHVNDTGNPHGVSKAHLGLEKVENIKTNLSAHVDPTQNDDGDGGYAVGSRWINVAANREFVCLGALLGAAAWRKAQSNILDATEYTADHTLTLADAGYEVIVGNHASTDITFTVPPNSSVAFPIGCVIIVEQRGASTVTIAASAGVTINKPSSKTPVLAEQHAQAVLRKGATNTWVLGGDLMVA